MRRRQWLVRLLTLGAVVAVSVPVLPAFAAVGVRTTRAVEWGPSAGQGVLAWTQAPRSHPSRSRAYVKIGSGSPLRLNARGTRGFTAGGAVDEGGNRVAYWQRSGPKGDIKIFRVASRRRTSPGFVNTARHEWGASISGTRLLFARGRYGSPMRVFVANLRSRSVRRLARIGAGGYLAPGDISGRWAVWSRCPGFKGCRVVRMNLRNGNRVTLRNPRDRSQFAPSVLGNGTAFYGESGNAATCGTRSRLFKQPRSGERRHLQTLPDGTSPSTTSVRRTSSSRVAVFYDQLRCDSPRGNIYQVSAAA